MEKRDHVDHRYDYATNMIINKYSKLFVTYSQQHSWHQSTSHSIILINSSASVPWHGIVSVPSYDLWARTICQFIPMFIDCTHNSINTQTTHMHTFRLTNSTRNRFSPPIAGELFAGWCSSFRCTSHNTYRNSCDTVFQWGCNNAEWEPRINVIPACISHKRWLLSCCAFARSVRPDG